MACGCPVITSNVSSLPEVAGDAGLLVDPESVAEIAAAMARIASEPGLRERLAKAGLRQAARFSWETCASEVLAILRKVAG
jgi:glycosyltransferase involved in cell wall biosynthesis